MSDVSDVSRRADYGPIRWVYWPDMSNIRNSIKYIKKTVYFVLVFKKIQLTEAYRLFYRPY